MFKKLLVIATLAAGLISTQASAAFVFTDWKTEGDKQGILDTNTGIEWLSLSETDGQSLSLINAKLGTEYLGWRLPTANEVFQLLTNYNPDMVYENLNGRTGLSNSLMDPWRSLFGHTGSGRASMGAYIKGGDDYGFVGAYREGYPVWYGYGYTANLSTVNGHVGTWGAWFLVSDGGTTLSSINDPTININNPNAPVNMADVSAPAGLAAAGVLMLMLGARRRAA